MGTIRQTSASPTFANVAQLTLESPLATLPGIGPKRAEALAQRKIVTVGDLVLHLPNHYQDWRIRTPISALRAGTSAVVEGELRDLKERPMRGAPWRRLASGWLSDSSNARVRLVWFNLPAYMRGRMPSGRVLAHGRVTQNADGSLEIVQPELFALDGGEPPPIRASYRLPAAIPQRFFGQLVSQSLRQVGDQVVDSVPTDLPGEFLSIADALRYLHEPPADANPVELERADSAGHRALAFDELFAFELALGIERARSARRTGVALDGPAPLTSRWLHELPFRLTSAQRRALDELGTDLRGPGQMNRMLLGDVGSGKTLVAFWAALRAVESGYRCAMMAPTELLAEQHRASFDRLCGRLGIPAALLTGRTPANARSSTLRMLNSGAIQIVFGTHALIQERVQIPKLAVAIIDEQHRFGVFDRARMRELGPTANLLMMTATPIPRSLAMTLFANLDVSFLDELPPGRTPIATESFDQSQFPEVDEIVRREIALGHRAYYVLPMIDSDEEDARTVGAMAERLSGALKGARVEKLHGRMRAPDKERVMRGFRDGAVDVLVSTTVIEVGIDVPEATVMVVVGAERYGLAQLHQLRGRVGRGAAPSRCCLVASADIDQQARARLQVLVECSAGAEVAQADLRLRGPGDLLGARQAGALPLRFVHLVRDWHLIERARELAECLLARDPKLEHADSAGARAAVHRMLTLGFSLGDVG